MTEMSATRKDVVCSHEALLTMNLPSLLMADVSGVFSWCRR